jgi:SMI1 / KNR4 family (SUKH-1)
MTRGRKFLVLAAALLVAVLVAAIIAGPSIQRSFFYPKPHGLPPAVAFTTEELLGRLQAVLATNAPIVAQSLQPGLSDAQISALEREGGFRLSDSLKSLYRWRNGMLTNSPCGLVPGQRFPPLEEVARERVAARQQLSSASAAQRGAFSVFAGHTRNWVKVFDDGAGDGYFYDPERTDAEGAFFYHLAEEGYYLWFPSLNNFLSGVIECYEGGAYKVSADGKGLSEDSARTQKTWGRLGKSNEAGQ